MSTTRELHRRAMDIAESADIAKRRGQVERAKDLFSQAFELEAQAAEQIQTYDEPTRSVFLRSAATLALDSGRHRDAEKLIASALVGDPPSEIADELRDLLEKVNFERHLELRGEILSRGQLQLSFLGSAIGSGIALTEVVFQRVNGMEALIYRTVERIRGRKFRERGAAGSGVTRNYSLYMSAPRVGSFAVTLQVGSQDMLPGFSDADEIINELVESLSLLESGREHLLKEKIPDPSYYRNFVGLGKKVAPDGDRVTMVGITKIQGDGEEQKLLLTRLQSDISMIPEQEGDEQSENKEVQEPVVIRGVLRYADSLKNNEIKIVDENDKKHTVIVPEGLMSDIVRPLWDYRVIITGIPSKGKKIILVNIEPDE